MEFNDLDAALKRADLVTDAAEVHGTLCGMICSGIDDTCDLWMGLVFEDADPENAAVDTCSADLHRLYDQTLVLFATDDFVIGPLLPDDNEDIEIRTESLATWCQGFLYGLSLSEKSGEQVPEQVQEIVADFAKISQAGVDATDQAEESEINENAYAEVVEYVRVSMQLVYEELLGKCESLDLGGQTMH